MPVTIETHLERLASALMEQCRQQVDEAIEEAIAHGTALMRQRFDAAKAEMAMTLFRNYDIYRDRSEIVIRVRDERRDTTP